MRTVLFSILLSGITTPIFGQIGFSTSDPKATLDVTAVKTNGTTSEGILLPNLTGDQIKSAGAQYNTVQTGTMVYSTSTPTTSDTKTANITAPGCYYFDGNIWRSMGKYNKTTVTSYSSLVDPNILGYVPSRTATASSAPSTVTAGTANYTKQGTITYSTNGHTYTAFTGSTSITWYSAYNAAKSMGGYLATFITDEEWQYVEQNLLTNNAVFNAQKAWIGFVKFSWSAGAALTPDPEEKWITGEKPQHQYTLGGNTSVRKANWFANAEPNNVSNTEGFVHTYGKNDNMTVIKNSYTSTHPWNDVPANVSTVSAFIVEFQQ